MKKIIKEIEKLIDKSNDIYELQTVYNHIDYEISLLRLQHAQRTGKRL